MSGRLGIVHTTGLLLVVVTQLFAAAAVFAQDKDAEAPINRRMYELLNRMNQLEEEIQLLRGDIEVMNHDMGGLKKQQRELYLDIDKRVTAVESTGKDSKPEEGDEGAKAASDNQPTTEDGGKTGTPAAAGLVPAIVDNPDEEPPDTSPQAQQAVPSFEERNAYRRAFNLLKEGRYDQSREAFTAFRSSYPESGYASNAQYWLGEANYVSRNYDEALKEFSGVVSNYPESQKAPDAMLKKGFTEYELKKWSDARASLEAVVKQYPDSAAARLAQSRLQLMQKDGH